MLSQRPDGWHIKFPFNQRSWGFYGLQACVYISLSVVEKFLTFRTAPPAFFPYNDKQAYLNWLSPILEQAIDEGVEKHKKFCQAEFWRSAFTYKSVAEAYQISFKQSLLSAVAISCIPKSWLSEIFFERIDFFADTTSTATPVIAYEKTPSRFRYPDGQELPNLGYGYGIVLGANNHAVAIVRIGTEWFLFNSLSDIPSESNAYIYCFDNTTNLVSYLKNVLYQTIPEHAIGAIQHGVFVCEPSVRFTA